ncbi:MAG: hypothetical protein IKG32_07585 [Clostridia bacterium]|nr:hypothetical protein [Clostridia bacterium]
MALGLSFLFSVKREKVPKKKSTKGLWIMLKKRVGKKPMSFPWASLFSVPFSSSPEEKKGTRGK